MAAGAQRWRRPSHAGYSITGWAPSRLRSSMPTHKARWPTRRLQRRLVNEAHSSVAYQGRYRVRLAVIGLAGVDDHTGYDGHALGGRWNRLALCRSVAQLRVGVPVHVASSDGASALADAA